MRPAPLRSAFFSLFLCAALPLQRGAAQSRGGAAPAPQSLATACRVKSITDGDTLRCQDGRRVRLLQIDAPEKDQRPVGAAARSALLALAPVGSSVRLETDTRRQDQFGRTLAFVWLPDGRMANEELAREGMVVSLVYKPNVRYVHRIEAAVDEARRAKRGVWAAGALPCAPKDHRKKRC